MDDPLTDIARASRPSSVRSRQKRAYKDPGTQSAWVVALLAASLVVGVVAVISDLLELSLINRVAGGEFVTIEELNASDQRQGMIGIIQLVVLLITGILFIAWTFRTYSNLEPLQSGELRYGRGWAIGGWLLPIANLFIPKQIINDVWRGSDPTFAHEGDPWNTRPISGVLTLWWLSFILGRVLDRVALRQIETGPTPTIEEMRTATYAWLMSDAFNLVPGILAIVVVRMITRRQQERAAAVTARQGSEPDGLPATSSGPNA